MTNPDQVYREALRSQCPVSGAVGVRPAGRHGYSSPPPVAPATGRGSGAVGRKGTAWSGGANGPPGRLAGGARRRRATTEPSEPAPGAGGRGSLRAGLRKGSAALAAAVLWLSLPGAAGAAERVALVIGNGAYEHVPFLPNPRNDASDVGAALGRLGFAVSRLANAGQAQLRQGLHDFTRAASAAEVAVVFYAGHGIEVDGRNFLVPVDATLQSDQDVEFETVPLELVLHSVERARGLRLVILDACRDNPFAALMRSAGGTRSIGRGLARTEPAGEMLLAYAAKGGSVAADGEGRNSPYTGALLRYLEESGLDVGDMFRKVRDEVLTATGGKQEPFTYGSLPGRDVYLASAAPPKAEVTPASTAGGTPPSRPIPPPGTRRGRPRGRPTRRPSGRPSAWATVAWWPPTG